VSDFSVDPLGYNGGSMSLYCYCGNKPLTHTDPTGKKVFVIERHIEAASNPFGQAAPEVAAEIGAEFGGPFGFLAGLYVGLVTDYYINNTWHSILVVSSKCAARYDANGNVIGFGLRATESWDFQNDSLVHHPARDFNPNVFPTFPSGSYGPGFHVITIRNDDTFDRAVRNAANAAWGHNPQVPGYRAGGNTRRNNCSDWVHNILVGVGLNYTNPNPSPFGPQPAPSWIPDHVIGWIMDQW
jgi:hypothetical protein